MKIAVVPGATPLAKLPELLARLVRIHDAEFSSNRRFRLQRGDCRSNPGSGIEVGALSRFGSSSGHPGVSRKAVQESITGRVAVDHLRENTLGAVVPSLIYPQFKRGIDFWAALLFCPSSARSLGICAIFIKLETPGPIFYRQRRAGFGGRQFTIFKLRTMTHNHGGEDFTRRGRPADYPGRAVLRRYRSRRVAANHQYSTGRHELDRTSPGGDVARPLVRA